MVKKSESMVDKENQWEDIDYSANQKEEDFADFDDSEFSEDDTDDVYSSDSEEYSEQDYEEDGDFDGEDSASSNKTKKSNLFPLLILVLILLGGLVFLFISSSTKKNAETHVADAPVVNAEQSLNAETSAQDGNFSDDSFFDSDTTEMVGMNFDDNTSNVNTQNTNENQNPAEMGSGALTDNNSSGVSFENLNTTGQTDSTNQVSENAADSNDLFQQSSTPLESKTAHLNENNDIIISYDKESRVNPFKPLVQEKAREIARSMERLNNTDFEIVEPPVASVPDANLTRLLQTQVSGILYDDESPSAIVNLNGADTFVKVGDTFSGYKIQAITKDKVQIYYKNNSYVASVGTLFVRGLLESRPAVANLEKKFAGRYKEED